MDRWIGHGICGLAGFSVFAFGAVEAWSLAVLVLGAAGLLVIFALARWRCPEGSIKFPAVLFPLAAFGILIFAQWGFALSQYNYATRVELLKWAAYFVIAFLAANVFRTADSLRRLFWFCLCLGFAVALLGILQHYTFNGKLYWVRELSESGYPFGPYVNRNHFAGFVELVAPLGLAVLVLGGVRGDQLPLVGLLTAVPVVALVLCGSRGGILSFAAQVIVLLAAVWWLQERRGRLWSMAVFAAATGVLILWMGAGEALERIALTRAGELTTGRRVAIFADTWRIFLDHPGLGAGAGTFPEVYPRYETVYDGKVVNHAHNDYVEVAAETGLVGVAICGAFLVCLLREAARRLREPTEPMVCAVRTGALVGCAGLLIHGLVDFNLRIPSNALLFFLMAAVATTSMARVARPAAAMEAVAVPSIAGVGEPG